MMSWIGLHKFADVIFGITQKLLCIILYLLKNGGHKLQYSLCL